MTDKSHEQSRASNDREGIARDAEYGVESSSSTQDFYQAVERLEASLRDLLGYRKDTSLRQAAALIDDASARLQDQIDSAEAPEAQPHRRRRRYRHRRSYRRRLLVLHPGSDHLYRGPNKKLGGVCAGFARYLGIETWTARLVAVTGLIFVPGLMLPAYLVACFVMDTEPKDRQPTGHPARSMKRGRWAQKRRSRRAAAADLGSVEQGVDGDVIHSVEQERYARNVRRWPPRKMLTHSRAELAQVELRLRRIESFVTSDQYELHKQLKKMEQ